MTNQELTDEVFNAVIDSEGDAVRVSQDLSIDLDDVVTYATDNLELLDKLAELAKAPTEQAAKAVEEVLYKATGRLISPAFTCPF